MKLEQVHTSTRGAKCPDCGGTLPEEGEMEHAPWCHQMRLRALGHVDVTYFDRSIDAINPRGTRGKGNAKY